MYTYREQPVKAATRLTCIREALVQVSTRAVTILTTSCVSSAPPRRS